MTAVEKIIAKYNKQWNKYGMGSVISYSQVIADLEQAKEMEREQIVKSFSEGYREAMNNQKECACKAYYQCNECNCK